jgi:hypothetical protein
VRRTEPVTIGSRGGGLAAASSGRMAQLIVVTVLAGPLNLPKVRALLRAPICNFKRSRR